jgi:hypothetical protein
MKMLTGKGSAEMLIVAFDYEGVLFAHCITPCSTVNAVYYRYVFEHNLRPSLHHKDCSCDFLCDMAVLNIV